MRRTKAEIQREFNAFAEKIARLESLKHELDALDTKGFETEAKVIRAKLKDVGSIPSISNDIEELRKRIEKKHAKSVEIGSGLQRKISHLEKEIAERKKLACVKQLSGKEVEAVRDIPKMEGELHRLKKSFDEHLKTRKIKIDSGVGVIVDSKFDDFISEIKADLTEKLKEEEALLRAEEGMRLKTDLEKRKELFAEKGAELESKKKNEELMLNAELGRKKQELENKKKELKNAKKEDALILGEELKKIKKDFESKKRELENKKKEFVSAKKEDASILRNELHRIKKKLANKERELGAKERTEVSRLKAKVKGTEKELSSKEKEAEASFRAKVARRKQEFAGKYSSLVKKMHDDYKRRVKNELKREVRRRFNAELGEKLASVKARVIEDTKKRVLLSLMKENQKRLGLETKKTAEKIQSETKNVVSRLKDRMHNQMIAKVKSEVKKKEQELRRKLDREYQEKLAMENKIKQAELDKRKAQMEKYVEEQAKKLFK